MLNNKTRRKEMCLLSSTRAPNKLKSRLGFRQKRKKIDKMRVAKKKLHDTRKDQKDVENSSTTLKMPHVGLFYCERCKITNN